MLTNIQLRRYRITSLHYDLNKDLMPEDIGAYRHNMDISSTCSEIEKNKYYLISINMEVTGTDDPESIPFPYTVNVEIEGIFEIMNPCSEKELNDDLEVNAPSLLYGILRGLIYQLSSQTNHTPLMIPAVSFYAMREGGTLTKHVVKERNPKRKLKKAN